MTQTTKTIDKTARPGWADRSQRGMVTAEYAVGVVFASALAGVCLLPALTSPLVYEMLAALWRVAMEPWR